MSFNNNKNEKMPGAIQGNPLNGLCEKVCIHTRKVFDACMRQTTEEDVQVTLTTTTPADPVAPLTFVSGRNTTSQATITGLIVDPLDDKPCFARVRGTVNIPMEIAYTDANNTQGVGEGTIGVPIDIVLGVPEPSIIPYEIVAVVGFVSPEGTFVSGTTFDVTACITLIVKSETEVELLVPSYGYCYIPPCQEFTQDVCTGFFELPLYPSSRCCVNTSAQNNTGGGTGIFR
jgi:hypothetical protein